MSKFKNVKWEVVEHSWSDTSIYDQDDNVVCTMSIDDEDTTEENQEEREQIVSENFKLISAAPEMLEALIHIEDFVTRSLTLSGHSEKDIEIILRRVRPAIKKATT